MMVILHLTTISFTTFDSTSYTESISLGMLN